VEGPNGSYRFSGYTEIGVRMYWNSILLDVKGHKKVEFQDGSSITFNNQQDKFGNTFFGTCHHQLLGEISFWDEANQVEAFIDIGGVKDKPKDYFSGYIKHKGQLVCERVFGTYMGYVDFDGERLFDLREAPSQPVLDLPCEDSLCLESDSRRRIDLVTLLEGDHERA
jgi:hypothetical protein